MGQESGCLIMNLTDLQEKGGFVDTEPVKKELKWKDANGVEHTGSVFVVRQPFGAVDQALANKVDRSQGAKLISLCIRLGDDASGTLTYDQAYSLHPSLAWAFVGAINEVNTPKH